MATAKRFLQPMPARANSRIDARSQELTKNLVHTRHQLENHFKSIKRREADFKKQKLVNIEEELKATARMARPAHGAEASSRKLGPSPREQDHSSGPQRSKSPERARLSQSWSSLGGGAVAGHSLGLTRSWSSPEGWQNGAGHPQFPAEWGGHGLMPKPAGSPPAFPLAVTRHCADVPACQHPPPHPGAQSMRPAKTRSLAAFATSHTAAVYAPWDAMATSAPRSPLTPPPRRLPAAERSLGNNSALKEGDEDITLAAAGESLSEKDPMIKRLGHFMALLGPRYKTISKEMIWEKAERGERTPAQRRLHKLGGIEAVGGGPDRMIKSGSAPGELALDSDGRARSAWLAARTAERDRRNRAARK